MHNSTINILVVEDNFGDFVLVKEYLYDSLPNANVIHADSLQKAFQNIDEHSFDVILLDLTLPDATGIATFHQVNTKAWQIPIIVLTGLEDTEIALGTVKYGAQDYIVKDDSNPMLLAKSIQYSIERRKVFQRLKKSEEQYKFLFHNNPLPMWAFDKENLRFLMVNEAAIKHYGFSEEEFLGMNIMDLRPREHRLKMGMPIKSASTDKKQALYSGEQIHCKKNGEIIDAEVVTHDIAIDGYEAVLVVVNDVTARNKARKQLKESEKMLRTISENFPNGAVAILDKELRYQYTAGKEFHIPGASHDYFYQTEYTSHFPKNVRQDVHENLMKVFKGESVVFEASYSGQSYMISAVPLVGVDKTINKIVLASQNISRQKEALKRVHFQSNILERLSNFVIVADNNFNITYFNKGAEDLFGERIRQLYSQRVTHLFLDAYNEIAEEALKEAMENKTIDTELKCINASKKEIWINGRFSKMFDEENNPIGILCLGKDISTDKKNAAEKEMLIEELTQNNSDLRQFSYITSHNLRSPLSNLLGIIRLIDTSSITDPMNLLLLDNFKNSTIQLNDTVNDLINVLIIKNKVNAKKEELNIMKSLERVINSIQTTIDESGLEIQADFSEANEIEFNHSYLESILLNLLTNAIKYKSPGKKPLIKISTKPVEEGVKLYFCDNGLGIDLERYGDRIFGLYQRFHDHADSKGLGLYIVNSQVRAMGGSIEVESEVDKGTTFIITFKKSNIDD